MIKILDVNKFLKDQKAKGPVTTSQIFLGKSNNPHPDGLFSEELFGLDGSPEYKTSFSWIELNCPVIHPIMYDILYKRIEKKIEPLLAGDISCKFTPDGYLEEDPEGDIVGMQNLYDNRYKWKFKTTEDVPGEISSDRNKLVNVLQDNLKNDLFFLHRLLVIPPTYRSLVIMEDDTKRMDEINDLYQRIIMLSNQLSSVSGTLFDILCYKMQILIRDLNDYVRTKTAKKTGMIRSSMLGKRMDFSARAVISPDPTLAIGEVGLPFRIVCQLFEPHLLYGLVNSPYANTIPQDFHDEVKKFLGKETMIDSMNT